MRIGVTYDLRDDYRALGFSEEDTAEFDVEETIAAICEALVSLGHAPVRIGNVRALTAALAGGARWDCVFNICEGLKGVAREAQVPALLEAFDIPYVFSDPLTLALALDKAMAKRVVRDAGVAVANFALIETPKDIARVKLPFPLFLKPNSEGSGKGVDARSRVENEAELDRVAHDLFRRFRQPVLVEEYLPGREFTVGIVGTGAEARVLGVAEIVPGEKFVGHGYGLENKEQWEDKLSLHRATGAEAEAAAAVALEAWRALRCRDGGRCDVRQGADGKPRFIEVNPLAGIRPGYSDLCFIAGFEGLAYRDLIGGFLESFLRRHPELRVTEAAL
ncbi:MAG: D-alanine--D-alanine ligase [Alphaproteobacteria bacterium]|nr:D-alanine--D-alanine ligase [Alphaproteobacteria bacterium]